MRRVPVASASEGMILRSTVYDVRGRPVLDYGDRLTEDTLPLLARTMSAEIVVEDPRTEDIRVGSVFPPDVEAKAAQALHMLLVRHEGVTDPIRQPDLLGIVPAMNRLANCLYPQILGDPDVAGAHTLYGAEHVHPVKVAELAMTVGRLAGYERPAVLELGVAAALMNIGYLALAPGLLDEPRELRELERKHLHRHPGHAVTMLAESRLHHETLRGIREHHERWDGSGYPARLRGEGISHFARIIAIADTYVALRSRRPHRRALPPNEAVEFISAYAGTLFDPELGRIFVRQVPQFPAGLGVLLNTGEGGVVASINDGYVSRPVVRVLELHGLSIRRPYDIDLAAKEHQQKTIVEVEA